MLLHRSLFYLTEAALKKELKGWRWHINRVRCQRAARKESRPDKGAITSLITKNTQDQKHSLPLQSPLPLCLLLRRVRSNKTALRREDWQAVTSWRQVGSTAWHMLQLNPPNPHLIKMQEGFFPPLPSCSPPIPGLWPHCPLVTPVDKKWHGA